LLQLGSNVYLVNMLVSCIVLLDSLVHAGNTYTMSWYIVWISS